MSQQRVVSLHNKETSDFPLIAAPSCDLSISVHHLAEALGEAIDIKDPYTHHHSQEVAVIGLLLARALDLDEESCSAIHVAGHLHDLGKIGVSDGILTKNGPLSAVEWAEMKRHPIHGFNILRQIPGLTARNGIAEMVLCHHECFDGSGYPQGLRGRAIPLGGRILAVADTVSAMASRRSYREPRSWQEILDEVERVNGTQLDPFAVEAFFRVGEQIREWLLGGVREAHVTAMAAV
jgi:HD-GYP domain-containing protein (c-di-GMP phosphodiesterase class II)